MTYVLSRRNTVHKMGRCIRPDQAVRIYRERPGETIVGWLYIRECRRCFG